MVMSEIALAVAPAGEGLMYTLSAGGATLALPLSELPAGAARLIHDPNWPVVEALDLLLGEERLQPREDGYLLPWDAVDDLDGSVRDLLGIPQTVRLPLRLSAPYPVASERFLVRPVLTAPGYPGNLLEWGSRRGRLFQTSRREQFLLDGETACILDLLERGPEPGLEGRMAFVAEVQSLSAKAGASLDANLQQESFLLVDSVDVEPEMDGVDGVVLRPTYRHDGVDPDLLDKMAAGGRRYEVRSAGARRTRIVVRPEAARRVRRMRETAPRIEGARVPEFLQNPEAFLPEDWTLDRTRFGERVKGLTVRVYRAQPFVYARERDRGWFSLQAGIRLDPVAGAEGEGAEAPPLDLDRFGQLAREAEEAGERFVRMDDAWVEVPHRPQETVEALRQVEAVTRDPFVSSAEGIRTTHLPYVLDIFTNLEAVEFNKPLLEVLAEESDPDLLSPDPVPPFRGRLQEYQGQAFAWMKRRYRRNIGALLADEMGLGKTVQVLAMLGYLHSQLALRPSLVVAPVSLLDNWENEIGRFCPGVSVLQYQGPRRPRDLGALSRFDIVLAGYETVNLDQLLLGQVDWQAVVLDEAQRIKNASTDRTSAIKALKNRWRIALTGTPVENSVSDLWSIVDFVQPGLLGSHRSFREEYNRPWDALEPEELSRLETALKTRIQPVYLRRTKEQVDLQIPPKELREIPVPLGPGQKVRYREIVEGVGSKATNPLEALNELRRICGHPLALDPSPRWESVGADQVPKLARTLKILETVAARGEKALVFTEALPLQYMLRWWIIRHFGPVPLWVVNGNTPSRQTLVDRFQRIPGFAVMILSPLAAGVGLTITAANHVIHYTRWWNPAVEDQATDRAHRIGQNRPVTVYHPVVTDADHSVTQKGTVEEILSRILQQKRYLAGSIIVPSPEDLIRREVLADIF